MSSSGALKSVGSESGWCNNELKVNKIKFEWKINNISFAKENLSSGTFSVEDDQDTKWRIELDPFYECSIYVTCLSVYVALVQCKKDFARARFKFSIVGEGTTPKKEFMASEIIDFSLNHRPRDGLQRFIERDFLFDKRNGLVPNDTLTLLCELDVLVDTVVTGGQPSPVNGKDCHLTEDFAQLLHSQDFSDFTLSVRGKEFKVHKLILAARSPVFAAMCKHGMKEAESDRIDISDMEPEVMQELMNYIYTGNTPKLDQMAMQLLAAADKYQINHLKTLCENAMYGGITPWNACEMLVVSHLHSANELKTHVIRCINENADSVVESRGWRALMKNYPQLVSEVFKAKNSNKRFG